MLPEIPEGAVQNASICIISYLNEEAELCYAVCTTGDVPLSTMLGILELAKDKIKEVHYRD